MAIYETDHYARKKWPLKKKKALPHGKRMSTVRQSRHATIALLKWSWICHGAFCFLAEWFLLFGIMIVFVSKHNNTPRARAPQGVANAMYVHTKYIHIYRYINICLFTRVAMYIYTILIHYIYIYTHIHIHVHVYVCKYIHTHTYIHIYT